MTKWFVRLRSADTVYELEERCTTIGRDPNNDLVLPPSRGVSRYHATLKFIEDSGVPCIIDHGSANGTFVNNNRLHKEKPFILKHGDVIVFSAYERTAYGVELPGNPPTQVSAFALPPAKEKIITGGVGDATEIQERTKYQQRSSRVHNFPAYGAGADGGGGAGYCGGEGLGGAGYGSLGGNGQSDYSFGGTNAGNHDGDGNNGNWNNQGYNNGDDYNTGIFGAENGPPVPVGHGGDADEDGRYMHKTSDGWHWQNREGNMRCKKLTDVFPNKKGDPADSPSRRRLREKNDHLYRSDEGWNAKLRAEEEERRIKKSANSQKQIGMNPELKHHLESLEAQVRGLQKDVAGGPASSDDSERILQQKRNLWKKPGLQKEAAELQQCMSILARLIHDFLPGLQINPESMFGNKKKDGSPKNGSPKAEGGDAEEIVSNFDKFVHNVTQQRSSNSLGDADNFDIAKVPTALLAMAQKIDQAITAQTRIPSNAIPGSVMKRVNEKKGIIPGRGDGGGAIPLTADEREYLEETIRTQEQDLCDLRSQLAHYLKYFPDRNGLEDGAIANGDLLSLDVGDPDPFSENDSGVMQSWRDLIAMKNELTVEESSRLLRVFMDCSRQMQEYERRRETAQRRFKNLMDEQKSAAEQRDNYRQQVQKLRLKVREARVTDVINIRNMKHSEFWSQIEGIGIGIDPKFTVESSRQPSRANSKTSNHSAGNPGKVEEVDLALAVSGSQTVAAQSALAKRNPVENANHDLISRAIEVCKNQAHKLEGEIQSLILRSQDSEQLLEFHAEQAEQNRMLRDIAESAVEFFKKDELLPILDKCGSVRRVLELEKLVQILEWELHRKNLEAMAGDKKRGKQKSRIGGAVGGAYGNNAGGGEAGGDGEEEQHFLPGHKVITAGGIMNPSIVQGVEPPPNMDIGDFLEDTNQVKLKKLLEDVLTKHNDIQQSMFQNLLKGQQNEKQNQQPQEIPISEEEEENPYFKQFRESSTRDANRLQGVEGAFKPEYQPIAGDANPPISNDLMNLLTLGGDMVEQRNPSDFWGTGRRTLSTSARVEGNAGVPRKRSGEVGDVGLEQFACMGIDHASSPQCEDDLLPEEPALAIGNRLIPKDFIAEEIVH